MEKRKITVLTKVFLIFLTLTAIGCRNENPQKSNSVKIPQRVVTDDLGNKIKLPEKITRAVSLAPNITEIVFAVGAGDKLIGVTSFCNFPKEAQKIRKVGDTLKPNIENIIALKPDVVLVSTASQLETFTETLEKQGIKVFVTNPKSMDEVSATIKKIEKLFFGNRGKESVALFVDDLYHREKKIELKLENEKKVRTFVQIDKSLYTIGKDSFINDVIKKAGGVSVTNDIETAFPKISKERAVALNPEAIILSDSPDNNEPNEAFKNSNAVKNNRVYRINADILSRPGPRIVDALEQIARALHPEKFK